MTFCAVAITVVLGLTMAIVWGGPTQPASMSSINDPFKNVDYSDLPDPSHFKARDATQLAFRTYRASGNPGKGSVVLVHGSSASSQSMHVMAKALASAGFTTYALDMRGHGDSGTKGSIAYVGQLEDDVEDFMQAASIRQPATLAGFSAGGGFALRFAGSQRQKLFASYLLLSPFISQDAPSYRPHSGGWVSVGLPRYLAIAFLNACGLSAFNHLPVSQFALNPEAKKFLTSTYSFNLAQNFRPQRDYEANIRAMHQPFSVLAGSDDEAFIAWQFDPIFNTLGHPNSVTLLAGIDHISLTLVPSALASVVQAVQVLQAAGV